MGAEQDVPGGAVTAGPDRGNRDGPGRRYHVPRSSGRATTVLWATHALRGVLLAGYVAFLAVRGPNGDSQLVSGWMVDGFELVTAALCIARGLTRRSRRALALTLGSALTLWALGDLVLTVESQ